MQQRFVYCLALALSGPLAVSFPAENRVSDAAPPALYLHLIASYIYPNSPRLVVSAPIQLSANFDILVDGDQHLSGRVEPRHGKLHVHLQGRLCSGTNVFDGEVELEKREEPGPQSYDIKAPFICQPHFIISTNRDPKPFLELQAAAEKKQWEYEQPAAVATRIKQYYEHYLLLCGSNEVRCLWFLQDDSRIGMKMTVNLAERTTYTVRDCYNWALQCSETGRTTQFQALELRRLTDDLPASSESVEFKKAVSIAVRKEGKLEVFRYDRRHAPAIIRHIYDLGGGYLDTSTDSKEEPSRL